MTTLRVRLLVLVAAIVVLAAAGAWFVFARLARTDVETFLAHEQADRARTFVPALEAAWAQHGDWSAVEPALERIAESTGRLPVIVTSDGGIRTAPSRTPSRLRATRLPGGGVRVDGEDVRQGRTTAFTAELRGGAMLHDGARELGRFHLLPSPVIVAGPAEAAGGAGPGRSVQPPPGQRFTSALGRSAAVALAVAAVAALLVAAALARRLVGPIEELTRAVRTFDAGDLEARVAVRGDDEIGALAAAFNRMAERRSQAERARRALVADVAHELRTPLTNLTAQIEALEDGLAAPDAAALASLHEETDQLTHLVEDLSELAVADAGGLRLTLRAVAVRAEFAAVRAALASRAQASGLALEVRDSEDAIVLADARRLRQALRNLVENAIAHTPPGGRVTLEARRVPAAATGDPPAIEIVVADTGEGIPAAHLDRVFERFHRVDPSRARATGGRGLGLAIVKQYVEAMGGRVRAESGPGRGTTMVVTLPVPGTAPAGAPEPAASPGRNPRSSG